jgi:hypothetical protein
MLGVITADIVDSRKLSTDSREKLYADLNIFLSDLRKRKLIEEFEVFRGDSFQCLVSKIEDTLRIAILIRSYIKSYISLEEKNKLDHFQKDKLKSKGYFLTHQDMRLGIGLGNIDFIGKSLAHSDGEAFHNSGEALDKLKYTNARMAIKAPAKVFDNLIESTILLLDAVIQKWTNNQAEIIFYKLQNNTEEEIAQILKISQPAVNQRSKISQWTAVEKLLVYFENHLKQY